MKIGHLDAASGVSGDMLLGALVGAGASLEAIQRAVDGLGVGPVRLTVAQVQRAGLAATAVRVRPPGGTPPPRTWPAIRAILDAADLPDRIREHAAAVFRRLATAEGEVHGIDPDEVQFHEIGALDTLGDVVGAVAGLADLGVEQLTVGPLATGSGWVETMHGRVPVPVPAVTALLAGFRLVGTDIEAELVTPTGAALVAELATPVASLPAMELDRVGVGAGARDHGAHPNVLRLLLGTAPEGQGDRATATSTSLLEATVDDLSPEHVPVVLDRLRAAGAHDAWATPVLMKKGRPGFTLSALAATDDLPELRAILYRGSSTIGTRAWPVQKEALDRAWVTAEVGGHAVRVKLARHDGEIVSVAPEADDVRAAAMATGRPLARVQAEATAAAWARLDAGTEPGTSP